jgi:hypothetical protein
VLGPPPSSTRPRGPALGHDAGADASPTGRWGPRHLVPDACRVRQLGAPATGEPDDYLCRTRPRRGGAHHQREPHPRADPGRDRSLGARLRPRVRPRRHLDRPRQAQDRDSRVTSQLVWELDAVQYRLMEGPCVDSIREEPTVSKITSGTTSGGTDTSPEAVQHGVGPRSPSTSTTTTPPSVASTCTAPSQTSSRKEHARSGSGWRRTRPSHWVAPSRRRISTSPSPHVEWSASHRTHHVLLRTHQRAGVPVPGLRVVHLERQDAHIAEAVVAEVNARYDTRSAD